jgi:hypothetical protein
MLRSAGCRGHDHFDHVVDLIDKLLDYVFSLSSSMAASKIFKLSVAGFKRLWAQQNARC